MRILFLNQVAAPVHGEMNHYVLDVAARLQAAGDTVALVHGREPASRFQGTGYVFDHLRESLAPDEEMRVRIDAIIEDFAPDVIQLHGVTNLKLDAWLSARAPTARFVHNHRFYCSGQNMTWATPRRICELPHTCSCYAHHILHGCGSANLALNVMRFRGVSAALASLKNLHGIQVASSMIKENLMRNGLDAARIEHLPLYAPQPLQQKLSAPPARRVILHHGGLLQKKGVWLMTKNLHELPNDVELVFAGGGELQDELERYIKSHSLAERVRVMGEITPLQWSQLYHQAALVVMPSMWNEPLGLAGINAMAHGKPVIAFRCDGVAEWLRHGVTGLAVPFADRPAFIATVKRLLDDPARLAEMGAAGRELWRQKFQPAHHVALLRAYYARIIGKN